MKRGRIWGVVLLAMVLVLASCNRTTARESILAENISPSGLPPSTAAPTAPEQEPLPWAERPRPAPLADEPAAYAITLYYRGLTWDYDDYVAMHTIVLSREGEEIMRGPNIDLLTDALSGEARYIARSEYAQITHDENGRVENFRCYSTLYDLQGNELLSRREGMYTGAVGGYVVMVDKKGDFQVEWTLEKGHEWGRLLAVESDEPVLDGICELRGIDGQYFAAYGKTNLVKAVYDQALNPVVGIGEEDRFAWIEPGEEYYVGEAYMLENGYPIESAFLFFDSHFRPLAESDEALAAQLAKEQGNQSLYTCDAYTEWNDDHRVLYHRDGRILADQFDVLFPVANTYLGVDIRYFLGVKENRAVVLDDAGVEYSSLLLEDAWQDVQIGDIYPLGIAPEEAYIVLHFTEGGKARTRLYDLSFNPLPLGEDYYRLSECSVGWPGENSWLVAHRSSQVGMTGDIFDLLDQNGEPLLTDLTWIYYASNSRIIARRGFTIGLWNTEGELLWKTSAFAHMEGE